jgi:hypothetical protein
VPGLELDNDVVKVQMGTFKATESTILKTLMVSGDKEEATRGSSCNSVSKMLAAMFAFC